MVKVKICGITNVKDALHAAACGADALGFVFFPESPRSISPESAREIVSTLPPFVSAVGLFVNEKPGRIMETVEYCSLDLLQLHGDESPEDCAVLSGRRVIKALRVRNAESMRAAGDYKVSALLLDAWAPDRFGGTGRTFDWELAGLAGESLRIILAGGLNPENVSEAVSAVRPYGVDVSSGVEAAPGKKDPAKVEAFIANAKAVMQGRSAP